MESPEGRMGDARKEANLSFYVPKTIAKEFLMAHQEIEWMNLMGNVA
jgi:hypothetical protein